MGSCNTKSEPYHTSSHKVITTAPPKDKSFNDKIHAEEGSKKIATTTMAAESLLSKDQENFDATIRYRIISDNDSE